MNIDELLSYAIRHFGKNSVSELNDNSNLVAFSSPITKNWFALLDLDPKNKKLNINCGNFATTIKDLPGFSAASLIKDNKWVEVSLLLSEQKIKQALEYAFKVVLMSNKAPNSKQNNSPKEKIELNFENTESVPEQIQKMIKAYRYDLAGSVRREQNFYLQGKLMATYEDNYQKRQSFLRYYPAYHDLTVGQARTYFTWRAKIRNSIYEKVSNSYAYIYLYELLNGIGVENPQEGLNKLIDFDKNYAQSFSPEMAAYLDRWIRDYIIFYNISEKRNEFFQKEQEKDKKYEHLLYPKQFSEHEVAESLINLSNYKIENCPLYKKNPEKFEHLLVLVWQQILDLRQDGFDFLTNYITYKNQMTVQLFSAAVFNHKLMPKTVNFEIDQIRKYFYDKEKDSWYCESYWGLAGQKSIIGNLLHEVDREVRKNFNVGRSLKPRKIEKHYLQAIKDGIKKYKIEEYKLKQPKIEINLAHLSTIREDAAGTRDSLLTEEELRAEKEEKRQLEEINEKDKDEDFEDYGLSQAELHTIKMLLKGENPDQYLKGKHLMTAVVVDNINERLFDEIGDNVIEFLNDVPTIIEDYQEDIEDMFLKGKN